MDFHRFYETWYEQLHQLIDDLSKAPHPPTTDDDDLHLRNLLNKVMSHYAEYYRVKSLAANQDVLSIFSARWSTTLERSLHWIAGWRPTTAFHLIYTESSILFESRIFDILHGVRTGDLGDLSPAQFTRVSELQCDTVQKENAITDQLSEWQEDNDDKERIWTRMTVHPDTHLGTDGASELVGMCVDIEKKMQRLAKIVEMADELRLLTLKTVVELLTPQQAVEFMIAAAKLQFGIRGWGLNHDRERANG